MKACSCTTCLKFINKHCFAPKAEVTNRQIRFGRECLLNQLNCSCYKCQYDYDLPPCQFLGDFYNTDGDCLASK